MECGELLIRSFLPETLLKDFDVTVIDMDTFLEYVAKARYMQKVWRSITGIQEEKGIGMA